MDVDTKQSLSLLPLNAIREGFSETTLGGNGIDHSLFTYSMSRFQVLYTELFTPYSILGSKRQKITFRSAVNSM